MSIRHIRQNLFLSHASLATAAPQLPLEHISDACQLMDEASAVGHQPAASEATLQSATHKLQGSASTLGRLAAQLPLYESHLNNYFRQIGEPPLPPAKWPIPPAGQAVPDSQPKAVPTVAEETPEYTHILWDWDGNLARTLHVWLAVYRITLKENGFNLSDKEIANSMGAFRQDLVSWGRSEADASRIVNEAHNRAIPQLRRVALYPGAKQAVAKLGSWGLKQGLVTTSKRAYVEPPLQHHGMRDHFGAIASGDSGKQKPDREPLDRVIRELGGTVGRAIIIGDSWKDLAAAKNAGIDSMLFYPDEHTLFYDRSELLAYNPTYVVSDLKEIPGILRSKS